MPWMTSAVVVILLSGHAALAGAQPVPRTAEAVVSGGSGEALFRTYCATCHGARAKGDGPLADSLRTAPPDLTLLARHNAGKFDAAKVHRIVDGRDPVKGHGGGDMPVWGDAFKRSRDGYSEEAVKGRIDAIVDFLKTIQAK